MLQGKRALVIGVANARSIAWGVADRWRREGAEVFVTYQSERFRKPVEKLVRDSWGPFKSGESIPAAACDVSNEEEIAALWTTLRARGFCSDVRLGEPTALSINCGDPAGGNHVSTGQTYEAAKSQVMAAPGEDGQEGAGGEFDGIGEEEKQGRILRRRGTEEAPKKVDSVLHSVAHAPTEAMHQGFLTGTTRDAFISAHVVSAYSLVSTTRHALPFLAPGGSVVALTYIGSQRAATNYNVMGPAKASLESCARALAKELGGASTDISPGGIRVNCLSPGPVRTMAARGIVGFDNMRRDAAAKAPLERDAGLDEIAGVATFLASPLASAVTGQTVYADCGFSAVV